MGYIEKKNRKRYLIIAFIILMFHGFFGDGLLYDRGSADETAVNGLVNMGLGEVPQWHFMLSFFIGIPAAAGYWLGTRCVWSYAQDRLNGKKSNMLSIYKASTAVMSLLIFGQHTICTMGLMLLQAAVKSGVSTEDISSSFALPYLVPFALGTTVQTVCNALECVSFVTFICKKTIPVSKIWLILSPGILYVIGMVILGINSATIDSKLIGMICTSAESWAFGFSYLCVYTAEKKEG